MATGRRLTAQRGYSGVGLSELLGEADVPKGSFYHYFASKEAYGCALLEDFVREYCEQLGNSLAHPTLDARARVLAYFDEWRRKQTSRNPEDRCLVVKLSAEVADLSAGMSEILHKAVTAIISRLAETLEQGVAEGSIGPLDDPHVLAQTIYHMWLGASLVANLSHDNAPLSCAMRETQRLVPRA